jgi:[ribosomal protein S18]-alanine N-acetyltransferase
VTITTSPYLIRTMAIADIPRVSEIERESFPTMWPQTAYKRELQNNKLSAYLVLCRTPFDDAEQDADQKSDTGAAADTEHPAGLRAILRKVRSLLSERAPEEAGPPGTAILGFVGLWFMVDEAHIVTIAVAEAERRQGLGEMLLIAAIDLAQHRNQEVVTLECRLSNLPAQALYEKYGFRRVGVRKRYYTDNNEDALIMTTFPIQDDDFRSKFERLRSTFIARRGAPRIAVPDLSR